MVNPDRLAVGNFTVRPLQAQQPKPKTLEAAPYLTIAQAARHIGVSERTIRNWIKRGILSARQINRSTGTRYWIDVNQLDALRLQLPGENDQNPSSIPASAEQVDKILAKLSTIVSAEQFDKLAREVRRLSGDIQDLRRDLQDVQRFMEGEG